MKIDKEMSEALEPLSLVLTKETLVNKSRFNQQPGRKLQDHSKRAKHKVCHLKRTQGLG